ncbi:MAG: 16S rRNA processing protein RimM [Anaerolineales bacterium]|nr:16S rRNA processing protein RimM [Anaerolineales bacterium]MBP6210428.1 16S rRNA processing protein RimM [Anaerolineales bacterium]MBP8164058.1 16S rRNA processing protein RimM [Anaerolineales bacterium]
MPANQQSSGSPAGEPVYLVIGYLRRSHGVSGEIIMDLHTDFPERIRKGRKVLVGEKRQPLTFDTVRPHKDGLLVSFRGIDTPEDVGKLRNQWVYVKAAEVPPLPEGQHYQYEMIGLDVVEDNGNPLGKLVEILETGANDVYVVRNESGKEILLPAIPPVILNLDMDSRILTVHLLDGL